jgi:hypothetical protein
VFIGVNVKILVLIVNYKKTLIDVESIVSLKKLSPKNRRLVGVYIWDNACSLTQELHLETIGSGWNSKFYTCVVENHGLSYIYNRVVEFAITKSYDYILLLDNDSSFDNIYFDQLIHAIEDNPSTLLFLPKVFHGKKSVSPGRFISCKGYYADNFNFGINNSKNVTAINSGMLIKLSYFMDSCFKYNESILFYGVDDNFMLHFSKFQKPFYLLEHCFKHDLSKFNAAESYEMKQWRFDDLINGLKCNFGCESMLTSKILLPVYILFLKIRFRLASLKS